MKEFTAAFRLTMSVIDTRGCIYEKKFFIINVWLNII